MSQPVSAFLSSVLRLSVAIALLIVGWSAPAAAQYRGPMRTAVTINPLGLPFKYVSAELEQKATNIVTFGAAVSYLGIDNGSYASVEGKLRLYPNEKAFEGFSIGIGGGFSHVREDITGGEESATLPSIAVLTDYNWLMGKTKRVLVGAGVGAKRLFGSSDKFGDINLQYPTARFQVGLIF
ncbi:MAG: hypothetical protein ABIZ91_14325 [Gemmatimonadaceae bacterium]